MSFDIGQKVVCVNGEFEDWVKSLYKELPVEGKMYVVRDVRLGVKIEGKKTTGAASILLVGINNPRAHSKAKHEFGFNSDRFRPLDEVKQKQADERDESLEYQTNMHSIIKHALNNQTPHPY